MRQGLFITFEGGEGAGKTTLINQIADTLANDGFQIIKTREPGGTEGAEKIRALLVKGDVDRWDSISEICLFYAARNDHINRLIKPETLAGKIILCDRFFDSTRAYQGHKGEKEANIIACLEENIVKDFPPDLTLILDIDVETGLKRAFSRHGDEARFEGKDISFHQNLREAFLKIADNEPNRCKVIDASRDTEQVFAQAMKYIGEKTLGLKKVFG